MNCPSCGRPSEQLTVGYLDDRGEPPYRCVSCGWISSDKPARCEHFDPVQLRPGAGYRVSYALWCPDCGSIYVHEHRARVSDGKHPRVEEFGTVQGWFPPGHVRFRDPEAWSSPDHERFKVSLDDPQNDPRSDREGHEHVFLRFGPGEDRLGDWRCECGARTRFAGKRGLYTTRSHAEEMKRRASVSRG